MKQNESQIQISIVEWFTWAKPEYAKLLVKVTNEGRRSWARGKQLKREGLRKGFPDLFLFVPRGIYHGMAIEIKALGAKLRPEQKEYLKALEDQGYYSTWVDSFESAQSALAWYLNQKEDVYLDG